MVICVNLMDAWLILFLVIGYIYLNWITKSSLFIDDFIVLLYLSERKVMILWIFGNVDAVTTLINFRFKFIKIWIIVDNEVVKTEHFIYKSLDDDEDWNED